VRRVAVVVPAEEGELARARLVDLHPEGFEERETAGALELAAYTDEAGEDALRDAFDRVSSSDVAPGWEDAWRAFHRPVRAGGLWIGPPWIPAPSDEPSVVVDPGRAFGTGAHPTTRGCLELLAGVPRGSLLDAGCGSGVVAVAAIRLGFAPVLALDVDPVAADVARQTAALNGVEIAVGVVDVLGDALPPADVVVANIELRVVEALLPRLESSLAVTSGYLAGEAPAAPGWELVEQIEVDGWAAHVHASR